MNKKLNLFLAGVLILLVIQGCNLPGSDTPTEEVSTSTATVTTEPEEAPPAAVQHQAIPVSAPDGEIYPDVSSVDTAPENRAPYGDSYDIDRLERPFTQDMVYIPDMDIATFGISDGGEFYFISIKLVGSNPNNAPGIQYSVELDTNLDSFGDFIIVAQPPFSEDWTADNIRIYADTNHDSAGNSASKSDAPFSGNGYDKLISDIAEGIGDDADIAWVRINAGPYATIQIAFKKSFTGDTFMYSVMSDAGLQNVQQLDYVDYFTEEQAGSPIRSSRYYPLSALYAVDNTCFQAFGFKPTGYEPKICPEIVQPQHVKEKVPASSTGVPPNLDACEAIGKPNPGNCSYGWWDYPYCQCGIG